MALLRWDNTLREYVEAGGRHPTCEERKGALLNMLPQKLKEEMFFRIPVLQESMVDNTMDDRIMHTSSFVPNCSDKWSSLGATKRVRGAPTWAGGRHANSSIGALGPSVEFPGGAGDV